MGAAAISVSVPMDRERTEKGGEHVGGGLTRQGWALSFEMLVASVSLSRFPKSLRHAASS